MNSLALVLMVLANGTSPAWPGDWPMWGRDQTRNLISPEKNPPADWQIERKDDQGKVVKEARNIKWSVQLGSITHGHPILSDGLLWLSTNNSQPRDPLLKRDAGVLMCFRASDGQFLWQHVTPRLTETTEDWPWGTVSVPLVEGDHLWFTTNRCETICLDIGPLRRGEGVPKVVWTVDQIKEFGIVPYSGGMGFLPPGGVAQHKDWLYAIANNGAQFDQDTKIRKVRKPAAPSLLCLNKATGKLVWQDNSPGKNIQEGQWSTPLVAEVKGRAQVIVGQGDGWLRSFDPATGKLLWQCDLNPKGSVSEPGGKRNSIVATPVLYGDRVYLGMGQHPANNTGWSRLFCIDPTKDGDISPELDAEGGKGKPNPNSGIVWHTGGAVPKELDKDLAERGYLFGRTVTNCVIHEGLLYAAEIDGYCHCFDALTGKHYWVHDLKEAVTGSPTWIDSKVYLTTDFGNLWILTAGREKKAPRTMDINHAAFCAPIFHRGVLYIATSHQLHAIQEK